jgi:hypothetical protein
MRSHYEQRNNQMKVLISTFLLLISFSVCGDGNTYQIYEAKDGKIFRLNQQTGELHLIEGGSLVSLSEKTVVLKVGGYYEMEDGNKEAKFLKYLGNGKFEKSKFALISIK